MKYRYRKASLSSDERRHAPITAKISATLAGQIYQYQKVGGLVRPVSQIYIGNRGDVSQTRNKVSSQSARSNGIHSSSA
jgi:hypothetical protein